MATSLRLPGEAHSPTPVATLPGRDRLLLSICLLLITALAWAYLFYLDRRMSASMQENAVMAAMGMNMDMPWTITDVFLTFVMWAVMMVGMMAGSAAPVLHLFGAARTGRGEHGVAPVLVFGLGYVAVWVGFSACAALAQWALHEAAMLSPAMSASSPRLAGVILVVAGAYQLTPFKGACLTQCRSPLGFLMTSWRDGNAGAFRMGIDHGTYCLGCCWALMGVLFVVGVMNLAWVAALSVFIVLEKTGPVAAVFVRVAGIALIVVGLLLIASPLLAFAVSA
jgi:predicted metal-binding membrane protein